MRLDRRVPGSLATPVFLLATFALCPSAGASDLDASGHLVFAADALRTYGFESLEDLQAAGAQTLDWSSSLLTGTPVTADDATAMLVGGADAFEGAHALLVKPHLGVGLALRDDAFLESIAGKRVEITFWGRALGAEPALEVVYTHSDKDLGPIKLGHVVAIRTGRETSDGWVEYGTGPIDGSLWGTRIKALVLTARYATSLGASLLTEVVMAPGVAGGPKLVDATASAVVDALEVRPAASPPTSQGACSQATVDTDCGASGECAFGHCLDASVVWGPVPADAEHRADLVARWAFQAESLLSDRQATAKAATIFAGAAEALSPVVSPRGFYGALNERVVGLRDAHTMLGAPPSLGSLVYPMVDQSSGPLDVCFGLAEDDVGGRGRVYALFAIGEKPSISEKLQKGDVLARVDGVAPDAWIDATARHFRPKQPNDPAADPTATALVLAKLIGKYAQTVTFSRCQAGSGCVDLPEIPVADQVFRVVQKTGTYQGSTRICSPRFHDATEVADTPAAGSDSVAVATASGITSVQFDGFQGLFDHADPLAPFHTWEDPMSSVFVGAASVLVDARQGHGGTFVLGKWLFHRLRGVEQPYGAYAMPRGAYDDPDPPWLFDARWEACMAPDRSLNECQWTGRQTTFTTTASPEGAAAKIAWVNGNDVSMNDIVPRLLKGRTNLRIFGPHPSQGAYGEISKLPAIEGSWQPGSMQVLDMRFGATLAEARQAAWESGKGVVPDQVVVQKVSDILGDRDTVLDAARAWLVP